MSAFINDKQPIADVAERASSSSIGTEDTEQALDLAALQQAHNNKSKTSALWKDRIINLQFMLLNVVATVAIIFLNKTVFLDEQLRHCQVTTAAYHFLTTFLVLLCASVCLPTSVRLFVPIRAPLRKILPISSFFAASIMLGNLSLALNTVGFNQLSKILVTPTIVALNFLLFRNYTSRQRLLAVLLCCVGVGMTNTKQAYANPLGAGIAAAAFTVTALYQIWIGKQMASLDMSAPQLLLNQSPIAVLMLLCILPFTDTLPDFSQVETKAGIAFILSGFVAAILNLSQFLIIGRTSALTFNIVSIAKLLLTVGLSPLFEPTVFTVAQVGGIVVAVGGVWVYANDRSAAQQKSQVEKQVAVVTDEEKGYTAVPMVDDEDVDVDEKDIKEDETV